jgi:hypothetical protein
VGVPPVHWLLPPTVECIAISDMQTGLPDGRVMYMRHLVEVAMDYPYAAGVP